MLNDSLNHLLKQHKTMHQSLDPFPCVTGVLRKKLNLQFLGVHRPESSKSYILHIMSNILTSVQNTKLV